MRRCSIYAGCSGIVDYDPAELVLTVRPATALTEDEKLIANEDQALAFEPWDHEPLFGRPAGAATIGGVIAAAVAGPARLSRGAARDHLLGVKAVSGRAEAFVAGGRVVKNVTGYDVPKLMAGSWGRLAAMTSSRSRSARVRARVPRWRWRIGRLGGDRGDGARNGEPVWKFRPPPICRRRYTRAAR